MPRTMGIHLPDQRLLETTESCHSDVSIGTTPGGYNLGGALEFKNGQAIIWCPGARHTWKGISVDVRDGAIKRIESNAADPLVFEVTAGAGYSYLGGKGIVVLADGSAIELSPEINHSTQAAKPEHSPPGQALVEAGQALDREAPSPVEGREANSVVKYKVARLDIAADIYMRALLGDIGSGTLGAPNGSAAKVLFPDRHCGPGWVSSAGDLQAVIYTPTTEPEPKRGPGLLPPDPCVPSAYSPAVTDRLFEMRDSKWVEVKPFVHLTNKMAKQVTGGPVKVTIATLEPAKPRDPTKVLLHYLGIAVGNAGGQRVRLQMEKGHLGVGLLDARGGCSVESSD